MLITRIYIVLLLAAMATFTNAGEQVMPDSHKVDPVIAAYFERMMNHKEAPIKSRAELIAHLEKGNSPIDALSDAGRQMFLDSLEFGDNGLASFRKVELEAELTPTQIYEILKLFGFQRAISGFSSARIETQADLDLLEKEKETGYSIQSGVCGEYVPGRCGGTGWCRITSDACCHPPSCLGSEKEP